VTTRKLLYRYSFRESALDILCLCKIKIAIFAAMSAAAGLFLTTTPSGPLLALLITGVLFMAAGAAALNQYQERKTDALMSRTKDRPLPSGRIMPGSALFLSLFLIFSGFVVLLFTGTPEASLLGLVTVFWYNGFYTWLKTSSGFAAIPGALTGTIPPAIGWVAGGGNIFAPRLTAICFFFFMWQVLHFFVHIRVCGSQYQEAGLPSISSIFTRDQLDRLSLHWLCATVVSTQFIVLFGVIRLHFLHTAVMASSTWLILQGINFVRKSRNIHAGIFRKINYYMLLIMLLMILDGLSSFFSNIYWQS
jgi:heme o synthase